MGGRNRMKQLVVLLMLAALAAVVICLGSAIIEQVDWPSVEELYAALRFP